MDRSVSTTNPIAIVLAAGLSRRMGRAKLELPWGDTTLLGHVVQMIQSDLGWPLVVVRGPTAEGIKGATVVSNPYPERGLADSLKLGVGAAVNMGAENSAIAVFLADQPFVTAADAMTLWQALKAHDGCRAVRPRYHGKTGHPVLLWARRIMDGLSGLHGDQGLGAWLRAQPDVIEIEMRINGRPSPAWDLDRPEDYTAARLAGSGGKT